MLSPIRSKKNFAGLSGSTAAQLRVYFHDSAQRTSQGIQTGKSSSTRTSEELYCGLNFFWNLKSARNQQTRHYPNFYFSILQWSIANSKRFGNYSLLIESSK